jgi:hypothetical protein
VAQTFNDTVEITGQGNQILELTCTANPQSRVRLMAVNSNPDLEGQIQFLGHMIMTGIPGTPSNRDGNSSKLVYGDGGDLVLFLPHSVQGIVLGTSFGGLAQLFHPNGGNPHVELNANETALANTGCGLVTVTDGGGNTTIQLNGQPGLVMAAVFQATNGQAILSSENGGTVRLSHPNGSVHVELIANETSPDNTGGGLVNVMSGGGVQTIQLNGHTGTIQAADVVLSQGDCAEDFDLAEGETAEAGSVMVIDQQGALKESRSAYDRAVAGVISGAGDYKPGITLDKRSPGRTARMPIALSGKAYCKVDAGFERIDVGDLLVTSPTRAHAMKATDPLRAFGAVIGKALRGLESGRDLIPILVSLQ